MNLEELRDVRRRERRQDSLQPLDESFYRDVADYVAGLKAERERAAEAADDPFADPEVRRLTDEVETAEEVVESIYERRVGKVVKHASFAAADMAHDDEGLTAEERDLFDDLVGRVRENRERVLDTLAADGADAGGAKNAESAEDAAATGPEASADAGPAPAGDSAEVGDPNAAASADAAPSDPVDADAPTDDDATPADDPAAEDPSPPDPSDLLAAAMGDDADGDADAADANPSGAAGTTASDPASAADPDPPDGTPGGGSDGTGAANERTTVRITEDVGEIYGVDDRSYDLAREDVVQLPADNARPLVEKDAAERL